MFNGIEMDMYRSLRRERTAAFAFHIVKSTRDAAAVLTHGSTSGSPYGSPTAGYDVDLTALRRTTGVDVPDGHVVRLYVYHDADGKPADYECYSDEDIAAWKRDEWTYVGVSVVVMRPDGATGESALWGIEQGDYWPGSDESDIWHAVPDLIDEALGELAVEPPTPFAKIEQIRAALPSFPENMEHDDLCTLIAEIREIVGD